MRWLFMVGLLTLSYTVQGTTYYAATNGISGNDGLTTGTPWPLDWALSHAGDSNTIIVMPGTFTGHFVVGSPGQIIQSQIRWQAKLVNDHPSLSTISIFPASASNVTVSGFEVTGAKKASGIFTEANYSTIEWNWVHDNGTNAPTTGFDNGIEAHDLTGTLVQFNLLEHNGNSGTTGHGVYMNGTNCTARGNVARYNNSSGIAFYRDIADNAAEGSLNVHIDNNLVYGNAEYQLLLGSQYGREFDLVGNTVLGTNASIGFIYAGQTAPCITVNATNNIFYNVGNTFQLGCGSVVGDYNLMNSAYFTQAHGVITNNPHFKNAGTGLYWLDSSSPAKGAALASAFDALDFFGNPKGTDSDIGFVAYSPRFNSDARVLDPSPASGADYWAFPSATWYVRPSVNDGQNPATGFPIPHSGTYGTQDGTSYANAFNGLRVVTGLSPGDTLYICGLHTWSYTNTVNIGAQYSVIIPSGVTVRMDYSPDPGTILGGACDKTTSWAGPDANGVYRAPASLTANLGYRPIMFEVDGTTVTRLNRQTNTTWTGQLGSAAFIGNSNFVKTVSGAAPSNNLFHDVNGARIWITGTTNITFQSCKTYSQWLIADNGSKWITFNNLTNLQNSEMDLFNGFDYWVFNGCEIGYCPSGIYAKFPGGGASQGPYSLTVSNCYIHDCNTLNDPDSDGHAIGVQGGSGYKLIGNRIERTGAAILFFTVSAGMTNNTISRNFISGASEASGSGAGLGISISADNTSAVVGTCTGNSIMGNTIFGCGKGSSSSHGYGIASSAKDPVDIFNNSVVNCNNGLAIIVQGAGGTTVSGFIYDNMVINATNTYMDIFGSSFGASFGIGYNLFYPVANTNNTGQFAISSGANFGPGNVFSNPLFCSTDTTAWGAFAIQDTSPGINAGTNISVGIDPVGKTYTNDIGAFVHEFGTKYPVSTARNEVGATVDGATAGDIISIPAGTADWTNTLIVLKPLTLQGAGIGNTVLLDDIIEVGGDNTTQSVIDLEATNSPFYRITGLTINRGTNRLVAPASAFGTIQVQATKPVRIDHVAFSQPLNRCIYFQGGWGSLVDHCTFIQNDEQGIFVGAKSLFPPADNWGDGSWATATPFGTTNALVIEDCYFEDVRPAPGIGKNAVDSQYGAVWTLRYSRLVNCNAGAHGSESGARVRSAKQYELYHNTFTTDGRESTAFNPRGGTGVIWSNTASGYNNLARINVNRSTDSFSTWGGATGTNPFDSNDPFGVYATGTHTGTNNATQLTKSGAGWTPNQWYAYTVTNAASGLFSIITSNTTDTIYYLGAKANLGISNPLTWNTGDTFYIQRVLVVLDQVGYSTGGRMSNNPPSPLTWIGDTSVPLYSWGNSIVGMDEVVSGYPSCQENRDYFNSTPKPGYVALVYPHPWIGGGGSIPPFIIGPPQNITIRVGGNASFSVTASGDSPLAYQWLLSGSEISGATTTIYTTNNVTFNANGAQYSVVVTNAFGSVTSSPALLTVQNLALMSGNIHLKGNAHSR